MNLIDPPRSGFDNLSANSLSGSLSLEPPDLFAPPNSGRGQLAEGIAISAPTIQLLAETTLGQNGEPLDSNDRITINENTSATLEILNNDLGDFDVLIGNEGANFLWRNNSNGTLINTQQELGGSFSSSVALGDLDGDGDADAVVGNFGNNGAGNTVWLNNGEGRFTDSGQSLGNSLTTAVKLGDLDGDGDLDIFEGNNRQGNKVWFNDGTGKFSDSGQNLGNFITTAVELADLDGNGSLDAFEGNAAQNDRVWFNNGSGIFSNSSDIGQIGQSLGNSFTKAVALGDVNGDNNIDAVVGNLAQPNQVWINQGGGVFVDSGQVLGNGVTIAISLADLNGDEHLDIFVGNAGQADEVWLNDGAGTFTNTEQNIGNSVTQAVVLGDLDNDRDVDAFVANKLQPNKVWLNDGQGNLTDSGQNLGNAASLAVALGDIDRLQANTLRVISEPSNGTVQFNRETGEIVYIPKPNFNGTDQFTYQVFDGGTYSTTADVTVTVLPVNDAPFMAINSGLNLLPEVTTVQPIAKDQLQSLDVEQSAAEIIYTLTELPSLGSLSLGETQLETGQTFSQADIDNRLVTYQLNSLETPSDRFSFTVNDGQGGELANQSFNISIGGANIPLTLVSNQALILDEGSNAVITAENLETVILGGENILYTLTQLPNNGVLQKNGTDLNLGDRFTQAEINNNEITYKHDGSATLLDEFLFTATSPGIPAINGSFNIAVSPVNAPAKINTGFTVTSGEAAPINTADLPGSPSETSPVIYTLTTLPQNGTLFLNDIPLGVGNTLTQAQIDNNEMSYLHNGTETTSDTFSLNIFDDRGHSITTEFNVTVNPVNNPPRLAVNNGLTIQPGAIAVISEGALFSQTTEQATLSYVLTNPPTSGTLKLAGTPLSSGATFTPTDLAQSLLTYQQERRAAQSDRFTFNVIDTQGSIATGTFDITISPANESPRMMINRQLTLKPGKQGVINQGFLQATDPNEDGFTYTLVNPTASGTLLLNGSPLQSGASFTQTQINNHQLIYQNTNGSVKSDRFVFKLTDSFDATLSNQIFNISFTA